jgi:hypothetical protein
MKKRKFGNGGSVDDETYKSKEYQEDKAAGLKASEGEKVSLWQRLKAGNIDDPTSEAYKRFGAGRGKAEREKKAADRDFDAEEARNATMRKVSGAAAAPAVAESKGVTSAPVADTRAPAGKALSFVGEREKPASTSSDAAPTPVAKRESYDLREQTARAMANAGVKPTAKAAATPAKAAATPAKAAATPAKAEAKKVAPEKPAAADVKKADVKKAEEAKAPKTLKKSAPTPATMKKIEEQNKRLRDKSAAARKKPDMYKPTRDLIEDAPEVIRSVRKSAAGDASKVTPRVKLGKEIQLKQYKSGGSVRGAGMAQRGVKKCRMV